MFGENSGLVGTPLAQRRYISTVPRFVSGVYILAETTNGVVVGILIRCNHFVSYLIIL